MRRLTICLALVLVACTPSSAPTVPPPTTSGPAPTTAPATTAPPTSVAPTATEWPPGEWNTESLGLSLAPPEPIGTGPASGSGCAPGGETLPDGIWFGTAVERLPDGIAFDLMCFWWGDAAVAEAEARSEEAPGGFLITNDNPTLREFTIAADRTVHHVDLDRDDGSFMRLRFDEWPLPEDVFSYTPCPGEYCWVWLWINDGRVTEISEQYVP